MSTAQIELLTLIITTLLRRGQVRGLFPLSVELVHRGNAAHHPGRGGVMYPIATALDAAGKLREIANHVDLMKREQHPSTSVWYALQLCTVTLDVCRAFIVSGTLDDDRILKALNEAKEALYRA